MEINQKTKDFFASSLITWYAIHKRDLPWRNTRNPYHILLSEIILQQTRVAQGLPYYHLFTEQFPTVADLALAEESQVLRVWQGLGYYSRARNLHAAAKQIVLEYEGAVPSTFNELIKLKGIGTYTASAIASFAYAQQHAVVDGNVYRVLARVFGIDDDIASGQGVKVFQKLADTLLPASQSDTYNQAIMEFGAVHCTPKNPACSECMLKNICVAYQQNLQALLPVKSKKLIKKNRYLNYIVFKHQNQYGMCLRTTSDIWKGLYDFWLTPLEDNSADESHIFKFLEPLKTKMSALESSKIYKHLLTHQNLYVKFFMVEVEMKSEIEALGVEFKTESEISILPKPILINRFLEEKIFP